MKVAVLGAGNGGTSAVVDLVQRGFDVSLWNRSPERLDALANGITYEGVLGSGRVEAFFQSAVLEDVLDGADAAVVCLPAQAHIPVADLMAETGIHVPVILNPGHLGGSLEFIHRCRVGGASIPPVGELSTLTYVARMIGRATVSITGVANSIRAAAAPGGSDAVDAATALYPQASREADVLAAGFCDVNMVLHPPGAILGAAWIEATEGDFRFYVDAMTPSVAGIMATLDDERRAVAAAYGHQLPDLITEMMAIGTVDRPHGGRIADAVGSGQMNAAIRGPDGIGHRYFQEDIPFGLLPLVELARVARVDHPIADALLTIGAALIGPEAMENGRTAERMGLAGLDLDGVRALVRGA
jgi:opine dehydrogenase